MSIEISKRWDGIQKQRVHDKDGNVWIVSELIIHAENLKEIEVPMEHLCISKDILPGVSIKKFVQTMKQVLDADLSYPIILDEEGSIFDGRHRVARALLEGADLIKAKRFEVDPSPSFTESKDE